jgi:hypothetical protein
MLGEDLSGRFDYLFAPLEVDESAGNGDDMTAGAPEHDEDDDGRWSRRIILIGAQPVPVTPATVSTSAVPTSAATPTVEPQRPPVREPTTVASGPPPAPMPPSATTRAPISVSPESRPPFPNQNPPGDNNQRGGLLGGLL